MSDDLVRRLHDAHANSSQRISGSNIFAEAAAAIEAKDAPHDHLAGYRDGGAACSHSAQTGQGLEDAAGGQMMAGRTYAEIFPIGCRVRVKAGYMEGTDHEWNGHEGTVASHGQWIGVKMDTGKRDWPKKPIMICGHNLVALPSPPSKEGE